MTRISNAEPSPGGTKQPKAVCDQKNPGEEGEHEILFREVKKEVGPNKISPGSCPKFNPVMLRNTVLSPEVGNACPNEADKVAMLGGVYFNRSKRISSARERREPTVVTTSLATPSPGGTRARILEQT